VATPVALFVYNRLDHTEATLAALKLNKLAKETPLYIFSDGPRHPDEAAIVHLLRDSVRKTEGFKKVEVIERTHNQGLARSIISGVTTIINRYGRAIVLEDDLETSPQFLSYMNDALNHYENDPAVFSVGGYQFPSAAMSIPQNYEFDTYAGYRCCSWGWATWKNRWERVDWEMTYFDSFMASKEQQAHFNRGGTDMTNMLISQKQAKIDSWAIRFCYAHFANNMHCIYPRYSLVRNIGLDGSGTHSGPDPRYQHYELDRTWIPRKFAPGSLLDQRLVLGFQNIFKPSLTKSFWRRVKNPINLLLSFGKLRLFA
jgi:hypothetical protein